MTKLQYRERLVGELQLAGLALVLGLLYFLVYSPLIKKFEPQPIDTLIVHESYVFFDFNSDSLSTESVLKLKAIAQDTTRTGLVTVVANADSVGSVQHNFDLSVLRARAVTGVLREFGVKPESLLTMGVGTFKPLSTNATDEGRQKNRSAVIRYTTKERIIR